MMDWRVPLADLNLGKEEEAAVLDVIRSGWLSMGPVTKRFEQEFAAYIGVKHAIAVTNATAALHLACLTAGLGPGDEVILPSLTFVATANAVRYTGATPVFADLESLDWLTISPKSIDSNLTNRTRAILVMHYGGYPCDMPEIMNIARKNDIIILEDAAHAVGSELEGRSLGTWGTIGCFSFFSNKNMTTGEGGMLVTDNDELADRLRVMRSHGMTSLSWDRHQGHAFSYDVTDLGYNYRIDELRAAIGLVQLKKIPSGNQWREKLTALYRDLLNVEIPKIIVPFDKPRGKSSNHIFPILLPKNIERLQVMKNLQEKGIQTSIHYHPIHHFSIYISHRYENRIFDLPITEEVASRQLTLPLFSTMRSEQVHWVVDALKKSIQD